MATLPSRPIDSRQNATAPLSYRYPQNLGTPPFDKWVLFEAKASRHILRSTPLDEGGTGVDRTLASVGLYLPEAALKSQLGATWDTQDLGILGGTMVELLTQTGRNLMDAKLGQASSSINAMLSKMKSEVASNPTIIWETFADAIKTDGLKGINKMTGLDLGAPLGVTINPRTDVRFKGTEYRTHDMGFLMVPRTHDEAVAIDRIINFFQFYMLPSYSQEKGGTGVDVGSFLIGYPYEFTIKLCDANGNELQHVNRIGRSILTSIAIDHAAGGKTAFVRENGQFYPVATKIDLKFQEVRLLGRDSNEIGRPVEPLEDPRG